MYLAHWSERAEQRRWPLPDIGGVLTIGRSPATDICLEDDPLISRLHATLEQVAGVWTIVDDGLSHNGTFVNARRVSGRVRLRDRDRIKVGSTMLTFCAPPQTITGQTVASSGFRPGDSTKIGRPPQGAPPRCI